MVEQYLMVEEEQSTMLSINGTSFSFHFYPFRELMYLDVVADEVPIVAGKRIIPNQWLLPSYYSSDIGNIRFETYAADGTDYVWWEHFNTKFRLVAYSPEEIAAMENNE